MYGEEDIDDDEEYEDDDEDDEDGDYMNRSNYKPGLHARVNKKLIDLQDQLIQNAYGGNKLNDNDIIRYSAMVEILKAVLMQP